MANIMFSMTGSIQNSIFSFYELDTVERENLEKNFQLKGEISLNNPVLVQKMKGVGTISNSTKESDYLKAISTNKKSPRNSNPVTAETAFLSPLKSILAINGTIKFINNFSKPSLSDSKDLRLSLKEFVNKYKDEFGLNILIKRYLTNLFSGKAFWRNRFGINKSLLLSLKTQDFKRDFSFNLTGLNDCFDNDIFEDKKQNDKVDEIVEVIVTELNKIDGYSILEVVYLVEIGAGAETYPSQSFLESKKDDEGRVLAKVKIGVDKEQAIFHAQKIGNGLRTIDTWYNSYEEYEEAIPVEVYGVVLSQRDDRRALNNGSFFDFFSDKKFPKFVNNYDKQKSADKHYIMSMFIKGGVLGFES